MAHLSSVSNCWVCKCVPASIMVLEKSIVSRVGCFSWLQNTKARYTRLLAPPKKNKTKRY